MVRILNPKLEYKIVFLHKKGLVRVQERQKNTTGAENTGKYRKDVSISTRISARFHRLEEGDWHRLLEQTHTILKTIGVVQKDSRRTRNLYMKQKFKVRARKDETWLKLQWEFAKNTSYRRYGEWPKKAHSKMGECHKVRQTIQGGKRYAMDAGIKWHETWNKMTWK